MLSMPLPALVERSLSVFGSLMGNRNDALQVLHYIRSGKIKPMITEIELSEVPDQMEKLKQGEVVGKLVVKMPDSIN